MIAMFLFLPCAQKTGNRGVTAVRGTPAIEETNYYDYIEMAARGLKNCNPGNIRKTKTVWEGQITPGTDKAFCQFKSMRYGYRALLKLLCNYRKLYGCVTLSDYITRWAPPSENRTDVYIRTVSKRTGLKANDTVNTSSRDVMVKLAEAISFQENSAAGDLVDIEVAWQMLTGE
jgi:hypothetical protein